MRDANEIARLILSLTRVIAFEESQVVLDVQQHQGKLHLYLTVASQDFTALSRNHYEVTKAIRCILGNISPEYVPKIVFHRIQSSNPGLNGTNDGSVHLLPEDAMRAPGR